VVVSYNVELSEFGDLSTVEAIGAADADIVCLQEVSRGWEMVIEERYADRFPHMLIHAESGAGGLAVLSRWPLIDAGLWPGPGDGHAAWHVVVEAPGGPVQLLNVHLRPVFSGGGDPVASYFGVDQDHEKRITELADSCATGLPTIVLGDFNEGTDGAAVEHLEALGFRNALPLFHPGQETWHFPSLGGQLAETIDHILFDGSFDPLDAWVVTRGDSDHWPVAAHLERVP